MPNYTPKLKLPLPLPGEPADAPANFTAFGTQLEAMWPFMWMFRAGSAFTFATPNMIEQVMTRDIEYLKGPCSVFIVGVCGLDFLSPAAMGPDVITFSSLLNVTNTNTNDVTEAGTSPGGYIEGHATLPGKPTGVGTPVSPRASAIAFGWQRYTQAVPGSQQIRLRCRINGSSVAGQPTFRASQSGIGYIVC